MNCQLHKKKVLAFKRGMHWVVADATDLTSFRMGLRRHSEKRFVAQDGAGESALSPFPPQRTYLSSMMVENTKRLSGSASTRLLYKTKSMSLTANGCPLSLKLGRQVIIPEMILTSQLKLVMMLLKPTGYSAGYFRTPLDTDTRRNNGMECGYRTA